MNLDYIIDYHKYLKKVSINDFMTEKYFLLNYALDEITSRWENFVCDFFGWNSYYLSCFNPAPRKNKPLKEILGEKITDLFDVSFNNKGMTLTRKLQSAF